MVTVGFMLIGAALIAVIVGGAVSVMRIHSDQAPRERPAGLPARVLCPILGDVTRVRLGPGPDDGRLAVIWCERFGDAPLRCDKSCFGAAIAGSLA